MMNKLMVSIMDGPWSLIGTRDVIINSNKEDLREGAMIEIIHGDRSSIRKIIKLERNSRNSLESDKYLRDTIHASIGDLVEVKILPEIPDAEEISLTIHPRDYEVSYDDKTIRSFIEGKFFSEGTEEVLIEEGIMVVITGTLPHGIVRITEKTEVKIITMPGPPVRRTADNPSKIQKRSDRYLSKIPEISFDDIGGLDEVKKFLTENIVMAIKNPISFSNIGYKPLKSILLYGPPGTGKTALVMAAAKESGANYIYYAASAFKDPFYGGSEKKLRDVFEAARINEPCILFIDEIDAIGLSREDNPGRINIVNQILTLMDQYSNSQIFVICCTNLLGSLDEALIRPGRMHKIEVPLPGEKERESIFKIYLKDLNLSPEDFKELSLSSNDSSGAHIQSICNIARLTALREANYSEDTKVNIEHVKKAISMVKDQGSRDIVKLYGKKPEDIYDVS